MATTMLSEEQHGSVCLPLSAFCFLILSITGLVDAHTHPVWAGERVHEFAMKVTAMNNGQPK
jgi:hypothetical protein